METWIQFLNCLKLFLCSLFDMGFGPFIWVDKKWYGPQITHLYHYHMSNLKKLFIKQTNFVLVSKLLACEAHIIREFSARSLIVHDRLARRRRWRPSYRVPTTHFGRRTYSIFMPLASYVWERRLPVPMPLFLECALGLAIKAKVEDDSKHLIVLPQKTAHPLFH